MSSEPFHTLDDRIDRVARDLTRGTPDPSLTAAIQARLHAPEGLFTPMVMAGAVAVVALVVLTLWRGADPTTSTTPWQPLDGNAVAALAPYAEPVVPREPPLVGVRRLEAVRVQQTTRTSVSLSVEPLTVAPIEFQTLPELEALHVDDIQITTIEGGTFREFR